MNRLARFPLFLGFLYTMAAGLAHAHPLAPSLLELKALGGGEYDVRWKTPLLRASGSELVPILPEQCESVGTGTQEREASALVVRWRIVCSSKDLTGSTLAVDGLEDSRTATLVRIEEIDGRLVRALLTADTPKYEVGPPASRASLAWDYTLLGFEHILMGIDHLLFVFGLVLLIDGRRNLLLAITAFTVGHSVTLALATLDKFSLPSSLAELGIAISLVVVGVELCRPRDSRHSLLRRRPWSVSFGFGLLHGMGFAGALREAGLPSDEVPLALFTFNLGIELGQLAFIASVMLAFFLMRDRVSRPTWASRIPGYVIGSLAAFWIIERSAFLF